jgi:hypothetical protein
MNFIRDLIERIPRDKLQHLAAGLITVLAMAALLYMARHFGLFATIAAATTLMGGGIELYQWVRKEGQVELADALCTAAPGWLLWAAAAAWGTWRELPMVLL